VTNDEPQPPASETTTTDSPYLSIAKVFGLLAVAAWIWAAVVAFTQKSDVDEITNSSFIDASAPQISQLVDQALLALAVPACIAITLTVVFFVCVGVGLLSGRWPERTTSSPTVAEN